MKSSGSYVTAHSDLREELNWTTMYNNEWSVGDTLSQVELSEVTSFYKMLQEKFCYKLGFTCEIVRERSNGR